MRNKKGCNAGEANTHLGLSQLRASFQPNYPRAEIKIPMRKARLSSTKWLKSCSRAVPLPRNRQKSILYGADVPPTRTSSQYQVSGCCGTHASEHCRSLGLLSTLQKSCTLLGKPGRLILGKVSMLMSAKQTHMIQEEKIIGCVSPGFSLA